MKTTFLLLFISVFSNNLISQNLTGKWVGSFETDALNKTEFEIEFIQKDSGMVILTTSYFIINKVEFYVVCIASMKINPLQNLITIFELETIGGNVPFWFRNCYQIHNLNYSIIKEREYLSGTWKPLNKKDLCGKGTTLLIKTNKIAPENIMKEN